MLNQETNKLLFNVVRNVVINYDDVVPLTADRLTPYQKDNLTASVMRAWGRDASVTIDKTDLLEAIAGKMIIAGETYNKEKRNEIANEILDMLLKGAFEECRETIDEQLDHHSLLIQAARHFDRLEERDSL